jgi:hypothetical protein
MGSSHQVPAHLSNLKRTCALLQCACKSATPSISSSQELKRLRAELDALRQMRRSGLAGIVGGLKRHLWKGPG